MVEATLARRLRLGDAVVMGLGSMIGAGVFAAFAPAAAAAAGGLLIGLAVAAFVAYCNATSSAQLAAQYPTSGGAYVYGREQLGPWWGYLAGWGFVIGKTASCAAMALTFAAYVVPDGAGQRPLAALAVVAIAAVNYHGVTRTAFLTKVIVVGVLAVLSLVIIANFTSVPAGAGGLDILAAGPYGILQSAGLLFFAFAGYARVATLGEEVVEPRRTIPRAILIALGVVVVLYAAIGTSLLHVLGPDGLAATTAPLATAVAVGGWGWAVPIVRAGGALAALGALLALVAGVGRTILAMARQGDLPRWLAGIHPKYQVPHRAEAVLAVVVAGLVLFTDLRGVIGFSSFGVLLYYFVANLAAFSQTGSQRRFPKALQVAGVVGCVVLVATLPWQSVATGVAVYVVGVISRALRLALARRKPTE